MSDTPSKKSPSPDWVYGLVGAVLLLIGGVVLLNDGVRRGHTDAYETGRSDAFRDVSDLYWECAADDTRDCRELAKAVRVLSPDQRKRKN